MSIVRVEPASAHLLDRVAPNLFDDPIEPARLAAYLAQPGAMLVVAVEGQMVIGQAKAAVHWHPNKPADVYLDEVRVAPEHQRRGLARALLQEVEQWARERGCVDAWLATELENAAAQSLYARFAQAKPCLIYYWVL